MPTKLCSPAGCFGWVRGLAAVVAVLWLLPVTGLGWAADSGGTDQQPPATEVIKFVPKVPAKQQTGDCWTSSNSIDRADAYRCRVENSIFDPCFVGQDGKTVVCDADPLNDKSAFRLKLTAPLPAAAGPGEPSGAWMLQLTDGTVCRFATGASGGIDDKRINYYCGTGGGTIDVLIGDPVPGRTWTIERWRGKTLPMGGTDKNNPPRKVNILKAWR